MVFFIAAQYSAPISSVFVYTRKNLLEKICWISLASFKSTQVDVTAVNISLITSSAWLGPMSETISYLFSSVISSLKTSLILLSVTGSNPLAPVTICTFFEIYFWASEATFLTAKVGIVKTNASAFLTASFKFVVDFNFSGKMTESWKYLVSLWLLFISSLRFLSIPQRMTSWWFKYNKRANAVPQAPLPKTANFIYISFLFARQIIEIGVFFMSKVSRIVFSMYLS